MSPQFQTCCRVEIVGPPGVGKTSLVSAIVEGQAGIEAIREWRRPAFYPRFAGGAIGLFPFFLVQWMSGQPFSRRDMERMVRLDASMRITESLGHEIIVLDQGPIYTFTTLQLSATRPTGNPRFERWLDRTAAGWAAVLDAVILLDAPGDVLLQRILDRDKPHYLKSRPGLDRLKWLRVLSATLEETVLTFQRKSGLRVLRFDTSKQSTPSVLAEVRRQMAWAPGLDAG